jgi:acetyl esterase
MALDRQIQGVLERIAKAALPQFYTVSADEARRLYRESRAAFNPPVPEVAAVRDLAAAGPAGPIPVRCYRGFGTQAGAPLPVLVFFTVAAGP